MRSTDHKPAEIEMSSLTWPTSSDYVDREIEVSADNDEIILEQIYRWEQLAREIQIISVDGQTIIIPGKEKPVKKDSYLQVLEQHLRTMFQTLYARMIGQRLYHGQNIASYWQIALRALSRKAALLLEASLYLISGSRYNAKTYLQIADRRT